MKKSQSLELTPAETLVSKAMPLLKEAVSVVPDLMHALLGLEKKLQMQNHRLGYIARYYPDVHQDALENAGKEDF